jgi:hypothetical protein
MMKKGTKTAALDETGLTPAEKNLLRHRLLQLDAIWQRRGNLGGNEARAIFGLMEEMRTRLNPVPSSELDARAGRIIDGLTGSLPWARNALAETLQH